MTSTTGPLQRVERWSPTVVITAGLLAAVTATLSATGYLTDAATDPYELAIAPFAFLLLFVGALGLTPRIADGAPWLARTGAGFAVLGAAFAPLAGVASIAEITGLLGAVPVWALATHLFGRHAGQIALILVSVGVIRSGAYSRRIGVLLLGPAVVMLLALVHIVVSGPAWATPPLIAANAIATLALGITLRTEATRPNPTTPAVDAAD